MKNSFRIIFVSAIIMLIAIQPVWAASTKQELAEIKATQAEIQKIWLQAAASVFVAHPPLYWALPIPMIPTRST